MGSTVTPPASALATSPVQSTQEIRGRFPALERRHGGHPVAYFDGPGGTQVPKVVADAVADYLLHHNANTHWRYPTSEETDRLIAGAREAMADFLGGAPSEIVFGAAPRNRPWPRARRRDSVGLLARGIAPSRLRVVVQEIVGHGIGDGLGHLRAAGTIEVGHGVATVAPLEGGKLPANFGRGAHDEVGAEAGGVTVDPGEMSGDVVAVKPLPNRVRVQH